MVGLKAGRYELLEEIGRGAMGVVFKAHDPMIGRTVAVKTMRLAEAGSGIARPELISRFQTEARVAGQLAHPNIVVVYDAGEEEGLFYITMEFVEGQSLQSMLDHKQAFPLARVLRVMDQACGGLAYAHQRKVVHRDVKPANLLVGHDDTVKITDFGTAKILQLGVAQTVHIIGTPSYMSPEQVKGRPVDGRADIFALGVILYELVTGEKPFPGQDVTTVIYKIVNEEPIPPRELDSSIHPGLSHVITKALAKEPGARHQSCQQLLEALRNYREVGAGTESTVVMPVRPVAPAASAERPSASAGLPLPAGIRPTLAGAPLSPPTPRRKPPRAVVASLSLFLLALLGVTGYLLWPSMLDLLQRTQPSLLSPASAGGVPSSNPPPQNQAPPTGDTAVSGTQAPEGQNLAQPTQQGKAPSGSPTAPADEAAIEETREKIAADLATEKTEIDLRLRQLGLASKVRTEMAGETIRLAGMVTVRERRRIQDRLGGLRFTDQTTLINTAPKPTPPAPNPAAAFQPESEKPQVPPDVGELEVVTDIMGARAVVRGPGGEPTRECKTPCRFDELPPGNYTVEVAAPGRRPELRQVAIQGGRIKELSIYFQQELSGLVVTTRPASAEILVGGKKQPQPTPATLRLPPGTYEITVQKAGYQSHSRTVELKAQEMVQLNVELAERRNGVGWVDLRTVPPGADILVNGQNSGQRTPAKLELPPGQHNVTLFLRGFAVVRKTVAVQEGRTATINQTLSPQ